MQSVNDDMDELFRRAAENYPLDTNSANWNKVLAALQGETEAKTISEKKENKNGRLLWLLLLLPLGLICNQLYSPGNSNNKEISKAGAGKETISATTKNIQQQNTTSRTNAIDKAATINANTNGSNSLNDKNKIEKSSEPLVQLNKTSSVNTTRLKINDKVYSAYNDVLSTGKVKTQNYTGNDFTSEEASFSRKYVSEIAFSKTVKNGVTTIVSRNFDPLIHSPEENSKQPVRVQRRKKFYVGVMGGVDATTIKFQKIENAGLSYGVLLGYQLNKKWSIEAGAYKEKKYYYSEGKYFNTAKVYMPPNSRIDNVSGNCKMIEVPVSVKYNFPSAKKANWFSTVGVSTYFMQRENYDYEFYYNNTGTSRIYSKSYYTPSNYFFSNISVSGGYSRPVGRVGAIRIEPYLKIPLSNMGVGKVPLFSTGLQVGITRKF